MGAGPRAAQNITLAAKARAILHGRFAVTAEDVRKVTYPVLRHRIFTNFNADAEGVDVDQVIEKILQTIPEPTYGEAIGGRGQRAAVSSPEAVPGAVEKVAEPRGGARAGRAASPPPVPAVPSGPPRAAPPPGR